jgi:hypothetical protein
MQSLPIRDVAQARSFTLAGKAVLTLQSARTNQHFTYRVKQAVDRATGEIQPLWFVSLLTNGSADEGQFSYIGVIRSDAFALTAKSKAGLDAASVQAFAFFWNRCRAEIPASLNVMHAGKCGRCGRTLTHPESLETGIGPECAQRLAAA